MWDTFVHFASYVLTYAWLLGAALLLITIPACMIKIFGALWVDDDEEQAVVERPRTAG